MSKIDHCVARVQAAASMGHEEAREILDQLREFRDQKLSGTELDDLATAISNFAREEGEAALRRAKEARRQVLIQATKVAEAGQEVRALADLLGLRIDQAIKEWVYKIGDRQKAVLKKLQSRYIQMTREDPALARLLRDDKEFNADIIRERHEPGTIKDERVKKLAAMMNETEEIMRVALNDAGANIRTLEGWGGTHKYDAVKMAKNQAQFGQTLIETLDWEKTFPGFNKMHPARQAGFQQEAIYIIRSHILKGTEIDLDASQYGRRRDKKVARPLEHYRVLHYKDAESWVKMNTEFGYGGVGAAFMERLDYVSRKLALMDKLGPKPESALTRIIDHEINQLRRLEAGTDKKTLKALDDLGRNKLADGTGPIGRAYYMVSGADRSPVNLSAARIGSAARNWMSMTKLGSALFSQFSDIPTTALQMKVKYGYSVLDAWGETFGAFFNSIPAEVRREFAGFLDVFSDTVRHRLGYHFDGAWSAPGTVTRMTETFMKASGMTFWADNARSGVIAMISHALGREADKAFSKLGPEMAHLLRSYGLDQHWDIIRKHLLFKDRKGRAYIVPERAKNIPDSVIDFLIGPEVQRLSSEWVSGPDAERLRRTARQKLDLDLHSLFAAEVDSFIITPDARARAWTTWATRPGTVAGEAARTMMQLKSFSVSYFQKVFWPIVVGRPGQGRGSRVENIGLMIAQSIAFGYLSLNAKRLAKGEKPTWMTEDNNFSLGMASFLQGGGAGIYGDFLLSERSRFGSSPLETMAGPLGGTANDVLKLWGLAVNPEENLRMADFFNTGINNTPYVNLWYTRAALDYAILNSAREALSPGWLRRREQSMRRNGGREYIFPPSQNRLRPFE